MRRSAVVRRIAQLEREPALLGWLLRAIVLRETNTMCARIGFHSAPGPAELAGIAADGVEMGYEIDPRFRRQGYAREAAISLMRWAYDQHGRRCFVFSIAPAAELGRPAEKDASGEAQSDRGTDRKEYND